MLIHKATMGVLNMFWTGEYRNDREDGPVPVMREYTLARAGLPASDWWEVPRDSALGWKAQRYYPCCTAVVGEDGSLVDIRPWPAWKTMGLPEPPPETPKPPGRTGKGRQHRRKTGLLEYLLKE